MSSIKRAQQVKNLLRDGFSVSEVATKLSLKESSVRRYRRYADSEKKNDYIPRILLFDIETLPMELLTWGLYKQTPRYDQILKEWSIVSWSAKWLFESTIMAQAVTPENAFNRKDASILQGIWELLDEADIVIGQNSVRFDHRKLNARFMINDMMPPLPYQVIDTIYHSRKLMAFSSHALDYLSKLLNNIEKIKTEFDLWKRCAGVYDDLDDQQIAIDEMLEYNQHDVRILEDYYLKLRPWIKSHPNLNLYVDIDDERCPTCLNDELTWRGMYYTSAGRFRAFRCEECKAIGRSRFSDLSRDEKRNLTISIAR